MILKVALGLGASGLSFLLGLNSNRLKQKFFRFFSGTNIIGLEWVVYCLLKKLKSGYLEMGVFLSSICLSYLGGRTLQMIGLTGGIGCGKSSVVETIREDFENLAVIDCDLVAREVVRPGRYAHRKIRKHFGNEVFNIDGSLNRGALGDIIFSDKKKRNQLNLIMQPVILWEIIKNVVKLKAKGYSKVVLDAPLLFESKVLVYLCYPIVTVYISDENTWVDRVCKRDCISAFQVRQKISSQLPIEYKTKKSDICIDNASSPGVLKVQVQRIFIQISKS